MFKIVIFLGVILLVCSALFSFSINKILYTLSQNLNGPEAEDKTVIRWGSTTKPTIGGISFFITFSLAALVFFLTQGLADAFIEEFLGMVAVVTLGFFIGLQDDTYNTRPLLKLMGQVTCGVILIIFGTYIDLFGIKALDYPLTIFWVVGIMNSINLLDNMDGVTGTISLTICVSTLLLITLFPGSIVINPILFTLIAVIGSFLGFLVLNWNPSKIYMGDTGSQFLGAFLAFIGIKFFWNIQMIVPGVDASMAVIAPLMIFMVPIMDTSFVFFSRIARGTSPFVGGKDHLTHNLTYLGVSDSMVPVLLGLVGLIGGAMVIFSVRYIAFWSIYHSIIFAAYLFISFGIFFVLFRKGERIGYIKKRFSKTLNRYFEEKRKAGINSSEHEKSQQTH